MIYVNGVSNSATRATAYATVLAEWMHARVTPIHNPSKNKIYDIVQAALVNKTSTPDATTRLVVSQIRKELADLPPGGYLTVTGHSQGAAIVSSALSFLTAAERQRIDAVSVAGAACTLPSGLHSIRAYVNTRDIVPIYAGIYQPPCRGNLLLGEARGTNVEITYYSVGTPFNFDETHGVDVYRRAAEFQGGSDSAIKSEFHNALTRLGAKLSRLLTNRNFWAVMGGAP